MKKFNIKHGLAIFTIILFLFIILFSIKTMALESVNGDPFEEPVKMRCTVYTTTGTTASGKQTRSGIVAGRRDWLGKVAALYEIDEYGNIGDFIGYYEILDTGAGIDTDGDGIGDIIINGQSVDVWQPSEEDARQWVLNYGDYLYIKIIDGKG